MRYEDRPQAVEDLQPPDSRADPKPTHEQVSSRGSHLIGLQAWINPSTAALGVALGFRLDSWERGGWAEAIGCAGKPVCRLTLGMVSLLASVNQSAWGLLLAPGQSRAGSFTPDV